ncbi:hypothetical protein [Rhodococcus aetherivorans]|uniref:hypothetical protein n=1 Tax=Rhodococcus aetherivorans TaxID=191292 RepID=UPI0029499C45|nr:hypothetical protein [Rhodococcus aetherivorans]MDV6296512.1 hypothetical protein [Rhodococcus aetherivorans]
MNYLAPSLGQKLERLLAFYHHRNEPELTLQAVATIVGQRIGEPVPVELLDEVRSGERTSLPVTITDALCDAFKVDRDYLRLSGGRDIDIDQRLRLWITIRDRGLHHFAARATSLTREDLERLIAEIERMTPQTGGLRQA